MQRPLRTLALALPLIAGLPGEAPQASIFGFFDRTRPDEGRLTGAAPRIPHPTLGSMTVLNVMSDRIERIAIEPFGNGVRGREANGCTWTRQANWFSPSDSWAACGTSRSWRTARAEVRVLDPLYPLEVGATGTYRREAVSQTGRKSNRVTECEVTGAVTVEATAEGTVPALVVDCDDGRVTRTTWYAPGRGPVAYREVHRKHGVRDAWVRID